MRGKISEEALVVYYSIWLLDDGKRAIGTIPGQDPKEWASYLDVPWNDVDRFLLDFETCGA